MADAAKAVHALPRGGSVVLTPIGPIQFGMPPETIKDSMVLGLGIPSHFVVPKERFVRRFGPSQGINMSEFEFPAYCNFFLKGKQVCLVCDTADVRDRIRKVFQETLLGPESWDPKEDFDSSFPPEKVPDLMSELKYFRKFGDKMISVDLLLQFEIFDEKSHVVKLYNEDKSESVSILRSSTEYIVTDKAGAEITRVPVEIPIPPPVLVARSPTQVFAPPLFGVTVLGSSHGFDPKGSTSGYVLWINRRGIMVDPPPNSSSLLQQNSIAPSLIDGVIVTHCHADHDAGTFQKILQEGRVTLMTTPTIFGSFIRKYAALSGMDESFLKQVLYFRPVTIGQPLKLRGGVLKFFYSLHSIPCVGFEAFFGGRSIVFSADHMNDPARIRDLCEAGVLTPGRRDDLLDFPWQHDVILHEAGVPPIHTPMETLSALPEDVKNRLHVVHVSLDKIPEGSGLRAAIPGVENTIVLDVEEPPHAKALEVLDLVASIPAFGGLTLKHASEVLSFSKTVHFKSGEHIVRKGDPGTSFFAIMSGSAEVRVFQNASPVPDDATDDECPPGGLEEGADEGSGRSDDAGEGKQAGEAAEQCAGAQSQTQEVKEEEEEEKVSTGQLRVKTYFAGDYFGEQALLSEDSTRSADIVALEDVKCLRFDRGDFKWLLKNTDVVQKMSRLAKMRDNGSWDVMDQNSVLRMLSVSQKTQLETSLLTRRYTRGQRIWASGSPIEFAVLVQSGVLRCDAPPAVLKRGSQPSFRQPELLQQHKATAAGGTGATDGDIGDRSLSGSSDSTVTSEAEMLHTKFRRGALLLDVDAVLDNKSNSFNLFAETDATVLAVPTEALQDFFTNNPGVLLSMIHTKFTV